MAVPRKPKILLFQPYTTKAVCNGERYIEDEPHLDTRVFLYNEAGSLVTTHTVGGPETNVLITGLSLNEGERYRARIGYQNASGWGQSSRNAYQRVPIQLGYAEVVVGGEPASGGAIPVAPSFPSRPARRRTLRDWTMATGHHVRRLVTTAERRGAPLSWVNLTTTDKDTLIAFLDARIAANEGFEVVDEAGETTTWFATRGAYELRRTDVDSWTVELEAAEVFG